LSRGKACRLRDLEKDHEDGGVLALSQENEKQWKKGQEGRLRERREVCYPRTSASSNGSREGKESFCISSPRGKKVAGIISGQYHGCANGGDLISLEGSTQEEVESRIKAALRGGLVKLRVGVLEGAEYNLAEYAERHISGKKRHRPYSNIKRIGEKSSIFKV